MGRGGGKVRVGGNLVDGAAVQHGAGALTDALVECGRIPGERDPAKGAGVAGKGLPKQRNGLTAEDADLEGSLDVARVVPVNGGGGCGIQCGQAAIEFRERQPIEFAAKLRVPGGQGRRAVRQKLEVEPGPADNERLATALLDGVDDRDGELAVAGRIEKLGGCDRRVEVMWNR